MNKAPLVSVIIPAYNAEKFIAETISSVLAQTYQHLEVIVIDDGSRDGTMEEVKRLVEKDSRVRYFYQDNAGQSAARNTAIGYAQGTFIAFLDADDIFLPQKIEKQIDYLEKHLDCGVSYCKILHFFDENQQEKYYFDLPHPSGYLFPVLLRSNFINPLSVVLRKELVDRYGAFEHSFRRVDEQYLWLKLSFHKVKFCFLDESLGLYRIHRTSLSNEGKYFIETELQFLSLLNTIESWMLPQEAAQYDFPMLRNRTRRRVIFGRIMAGNNLFARLVLRIYHKKRDKKLLKI